MTNDKSPSVTPANKVEGESETKHDTAKATDAKEEARRRSKEDLERKRRLNRSSHGKR